MFFKNNALIDDDDLGLIDNDGLINDDSMMNY